jgi:phage terminase large subunit-like protein
MTPNTAASCPPPPAWAVRTAADRAALAAGYHWDADAAAAVVEFAETHIAPKYVEGAFRLFDWQRRTLMSLYGWRRPDGRRRFRKALLHLAKKNGKTLITAVIAEYELYGGVIASPLVVSASTTKQNAGQVFEQINHAVGKSEALKDISRVVPSEKRIRVEKRDGDYWSMSSDAPGAEGWNISCGIIDECHAHESPKLFNTLDYGTTGRVGGFLLIISTAGEDLTHFYYGKVCKARRILAGEDLDPAWYVEVYEVDPDRDDLDAPATWRKANPSLDEPGYPAFTSDIFGEELRAARDEGGIQWRNFLRYRLNVFIAAEENVWMSVDVWDRCKGPLDEAALRAAPCFLALDGSQGTDPASVTACWLLDGPKYAFRSWAWVCEEGVRRREKSNLPKYRQYADAGVMTITPGMKLDKAAVLRHFAGLASAYRIAGVTGDGNLVWVFGDELTDVTGVEWRPMDQTFRNYSPLVKGLLAQAMSGHVVHDGNPLLRAAVGHVRLKQNDRDEVAPSKSRSVDKIDPAVTALMAFGLAHAFGVSAPPPEAAGYCFAV